MSDTLRDRIAAAMLNTIENSGFDLPPEDWVPWLADAAITVIAQGGLLMIDDDSATSIAVRECREVRRGEVVVQRITATRKLLSDGQDVVSFDYDFDINWVADLGLLEAAKADLNERCRGE